MRYLISTRPNTSKLLLTTTTILFCILFCTINSDAQNKNGKHKFTRKSSELSDSTWVVDPSTGDIKMVISKKDELDYLYETADQMPQFANGKIKLAQYIKDNLVYPEKAKVKMVEGKVMIIFNVDKNGNTRDVGIKYSPCNFELEQAAVNLVKGFPRWKPAKIKGKAVNIKMVLPVVFKLK